MNPQHCCLRQFPMKIRKHIEDYDYFITMGRYVDGKLSQQEIKELEDIFLTKEFKSLSWRQRLWVRIKVAIIGTLSM